jgi:UDPglucose 6-dehydrogenase
MDLRSAELTKYAANAMLATKISFMNELANLAERLGADIERVRIGFQFIWPGCAAPSRLAMCPSCSRPWKR